MCTLLFSFFPKEKLHCIKEYYKSNHEVTILYAENEEAYKFYLLNYKVDIFFFYHDAPTINLKTVLKNLQALPIYTLQPCKILSDKAKYPAYQLQDFICTKFYTLPDWHNNTKKLIRFVESSYETTYKIEGFTSGFFQGKSGKQIVNVPLIDILYFESFSKKSILHTVDGVFIVPAPLYRVQESLPENVFIRTHRSFIVNLHKIYMVHHETLKVEFYDYASYALISRNYRKMLHIGHI